MTENHDKSGAGVPAYKDPLRGLQPQTAVARAGYDHNFSELAAKPPLFLTSTFCFPNAKAGEEHFARAYGLPGNDGQAPGLIYSRLNNPSVEIAEDKMVAAERGASHALLFPSGMSAITTMILALVPSGGRILYCDPVYGGTYFFLKDLVGPRFGVETVPVDTGDLAQVEAALRDQGPFDMVYLETPANPTMMITDIGAVTALTRQYCKPETLVVVDNTFMGPVFQSPFDHGADVVVYSATKFIGGHSDLIGGFVLTKEKAHIDNVGGFRTILGPTPAAFEAWLITRSLETLWARFEREAQNAMVVAQKISEHPKVDRVIYPGLLTEADGDQYTVYRKQCSGPGAVMSFVLKDDSRDAAFRVLDAVLICQLAVSLGGTETLIEHPRSMTHSDMSIEDLDRCGINEGMIRLSVGLEHPDDLVTDLWKALDQA